MVLTARRCLPCADGGQVFRADFIHCDKFKTHAGFVASATTWKAWKHIWVKWAKLTILPRFIRFIQLQLVVKEEDTTQLQVPLTGVDQELFLVYLDFKTLQETSFIYVFLTKFCALYSCISSTAFLVFLCNCILLGSVRVNCQDNWFFQLGAKRKAVRCCPTDLTSVRTLKWTFWVLNLCLPCLLCCSQPLIICFYLPQASG